MIEKYLISATSEVTMWEDCRQSKLQNPWVWDIWEKKSIPVWLYIFRLEYKYSKLVMTTNSKECELPAADSCAIMEGEDNEEEIVYSNKQSLLGKLKSLATKVSSNYQY